MSRFRRTFRTKSAGARAEKGSHTRELCRPIRGVVHYRPTEFQVNRKIYIRAVNF